MAVSVFRILPYAKLYPDLSADSTLSCYSVVLSAALAQFKEDDAGGVKTGAAQTHKWKAGVVVTAMGGPCRSIVGYVPVPIEWPEQTVKVCEQEVSPGVKVATRPWTKRPS